MERYTYWCDDGNGGGEWRVNTICGKEQRGPHVDRLAAIEDILGDDYDLDRLRELVEADRNGILITALFKVDDAVYVITFTCGSRLLGREIIKCKVSTMRIKSDGVTIGYSCRGRYSNGNPYNGNFVYKSIGKTVFRTREAAEAALKGEAYGG